jgi:hypothetical protein
MLSISKIKSTVLLASATLLCTSPLAAAIKTKPSITRVKAHTASTPHLRSTSSGASSKAKATSQESSSASSAPTRKSAKTKTTSTRGARKGRVVSVTVSKPKYHGQQSIDEARTIEIQEALIREHYLYGEATGEWDQPTRDALYRFQNDNHWQTKILPDARALIKLGLGPVQQRLLNPESAAFAVPYKLGIEKPTPEGSN